MNPKHLHFLKNAVAALAFQSLFFCLSIPVGTAQKPNAGVTKPPILVVTDASWEVSNSQTEFGEYAEWAKNLPAPGAPLKGGNAMAEVAAIFEASTVIPGTKPIWRRYRASDNWESYTFRKTIPLGNEPIKSVTLQVNCDDAARVYINQKLVDLKKLNASMQGQRGGEMNFKQLTTFMYNQIETYDVTSYFFTNTTNVVIAEVMNQPYGGNHAYLSASIKVEFSPVSKPVAAASVPAKKADPVSTPVATPREKRPEVPKTTIKPPETPPASAPETHVFRTGSDAVVEKLKVGDILELGNINFKADDFHLDSTSNNTLMALAMLLKANPALRIEVGGHTNLLPDVDFANRLSENRAKSVVTFLTGKGISASQVAYKGYGKTTPKVSGTSTSANRQNQRVEIKIIAK